MADVKVDPDLFWQRLMKLHKSWNVSSSPAAAAPAQPRASSLPPQPAHPVPTWPPPAGRAREGGPVQGRRRAGHRHGQRQRGRALQQVGRSADVAAWLRVPRHRDRAVQPAHLRAHQHEEGCAAPSPTPPQLPQLGPSSPSQPARLPPCLPPSQLLRPRTTCVRRARGPAER